MESEEKVGERKDEEWNGRKKETLEAELGERRWSKN